MFGLAEADDIALLMMISVLSVLILLTILERFKKSYRQTNFIDQHPKVRVFELFTKQSLASYTGSVDDLPIFVAVCGKVFDVSSAQRFYGKDGPYNCFAGKDATIMLAKGSFSDTGDVSISDLTLSERKTLDEWLQHFHRKYIHVGDLV